MKYAFIKSHSGQHKVNRLVSALHVSSSGYYAWLVRPESARATSDRELVRKIELFHRASRCIYGAPRIHKDLVAQDEKVSCKRVERLMREKGIQSKMARKFVITTDSKNTLAPAPDYLQRQFSVQDKILPG